MAESLPLAPTREVRTELTRQLLARKSLLAGTLVLLILAAGTGLAAPLVIGGIVDVAITGGTVGTVLQLGAVLTGAVLANGLLQAVSIIALSRLLEPVLADLRERILQRSLHLPRATVQRAGAGELVSRATDDIAVVGETITGVIPALASSVFTIVLAGVGLAVLDWRYLAVFLVVLPVHVFAVRRYLRTAPQIYRAERQAMADRAKHVLESVQCLDSVLAYRLTARRTAAIAKASWDVVRWAVRARIVVNRFFARLNLAEFLGMSSILVIGFGLVDAGVGTVGGTTAAMLLFLRLFAPIGELLLVIDDLQSAAASLARIVGVITAGNTEVKADNAAALSIESVDYAYDGAILVVDGVSLRVDDGETVALVGASGAGKSTVAALAAGVLEPLAGTLRRPARVALVTQEVHVFAGTLRDDLTLADPAADDELLNAALTDVGLREWVDQLPAGLDTSIGGHGHPLTPAQAQQLALARLIVMNPRLAVVDEATAEAGAGGSRQLERASAAALQGRAALIVAHRLTQAAAADRVLVMDGGRIVEQGGHAELLAAGGRYAELWRAWTRGRD